MRQAKNTIVRATLFVCYVMLITACTSAPYKSTEATEPHNLGQLKAELYAYQNSGAYERALVAAEAPITRWLQQRAPQVTTATPALVLDIDETSLSNWPQLAANDFAYIPDAECKSLPQGPCGSRAWNAMAKAQPIAPTLALFNEAKRLGIKIFFITGRRNSERVVTAENLRNAGYEGYERLVMKPDELNVKSAADYKSAARARIDAEGYDIIANVGDQESDLDGGYAEKLFKLPNPFYFIR